TGQVRLGECPHKEWYILPPFPAAYVEEIRSAQVILPAYIRADCCRRRLMKPRVGGFMDDGNLVPGQTQSPYQITFRVFTDGNNVLRPRPGNPMVQPAPQIRRPQGLRPGHSVGVGGVDSVVQC